MVQIFPIVILRIQSVAKMLGGVAKNDGSRFPGCDRKHTTSQQNYWEGSQKVMVCGVLVVKVAIQKVAK